MTGGRRGVPQNPANWTVCLSVTLVGLAKTAEPIEMLFGLRTRVGPGNLVLDGSQISHWKAHFGEREAHCKVQDFLPWAVQKPLNRSIWRLGFGLWWAEGSTSSINRIRQVVRMCPRTLYHDLCKNGWRDGFAVWVVVSEGPNRKKYKFNRIRQVAPICSHGRAHWRHLVNAIEPSVCCGDTTLSQITLTACFTPLLHLNTCSHEGHWRHVEEPPRWTVNRIVPSERFSSLVLFLLFLFLVPGGRLSWLTVTAF